MGFFDIAKGIATDFVQALTADWWVEVTTADPAFTYYFGPFEQLEEAELAQAGYVEDLEQEGATGITATIKRCSPEEVTIAHSSYSAPS